MIFLKNLRYMAFSLALLLVTPGVWGQNWIGTLGGGDGTTWTDGDNWSTGLVPEGGDTATFSMPATVDISSNPTVDSLVITVAGDVTLTGGGTLTVSNDITVGGTFSTGTNAITIDGTTTGAGAWTAGAGTVTVGGNFGATNFTQAGGTLLLNGTTAAFNPGGNLGSLELGGAAVVTLSDDITLNGNLTVGGTFSTGTNAITIDGT
ncbi:MAG TPA: hypothetical protein PLJ76_10985, partial [Treponemataceae bacterium]|nr:hypothetical protein [Treponemataceae bacterium]